VNISNASPLWVSEIDLNNVLSDLGGLARPRETALSAQRLLERNAIRA